MFCARAFWSSPPRASTCRLRSNTGPSTDGKDFHKLASVADAVSGSRKGYITEFWAEAKAEQLRYVRIVAKNRGKDRLFCDEVIVNPAPRGTVTKPICGTWLALNAPDATTEQWTQLVADCRGLGMEYLVVNFIAWDGQAFYPSKLLPVATQKCPDALEAVLAAADKFGMKVFVANGFTGAGQSSTADARAIELRRAVIREIAGNYAHHKSFYGWYWPDEADIGITGHTPRPFFPTTTSNM